MMTTTRWILVAVAACLITAVLAVVVTVSLAGSGSDGDASASDGERKYGLALEAAAPTVTQRLGEQRALTLGRQACDVVRAGGSFSEAQGVMTSRGFTPDEAATVTDMAESFLCPS